jgi:hypothetical protein
VHAQQAGTEYLRGLAFYEGKARSAGQTALLQQIEAEKLKVAGQDPGAGHSARGAGQNLDFKVS